MRPEGKCRATAEHAAAAHAAAAAAAHAAAAAAHVATAAAAHEAAAAVHAAAAAAAPGEASPVSSNCNFFLHFLLQLSPLQIPQNVECPRARRVKQRVSFVAAPLLLNQTLNPKP